jgi:hypothetical protein
VGKKVQQLKADMGVVGIVEGKLGGGGSTRDRAGAARFQGWRRCSGDWSAGRRRQIGQVASAWRCSADGVLGEGGKRGGTLVRLELERRRRVRSLARRSRLRVRGKRKKSGSGRGNEMWQCWWSWRGGGAERADGSGQRSSGEVVERGKE